MNSVHANELSEKKKENKIKKKQQTHIIILQSHLQLFKPLIHRGLMHVPPCSFDLFGSLAGRSLKAEVRAKKNGDRSKRKQPFGMGSNA
jgi:hypothetical protein